MSKQRSLAPASTPIFPIYLIPSFTILTSLPFRNRHASTASSSSTFSSNSTTASGTPMTTSPSPNSCLEESNQSPSPSCSPASNQSFRSFSLPSLSPSIALPPPMTSTSKALPNLQTTHAPLIRCKTCTAHLGFTTQIISKGFTGRHGRAYLISPPPPLPLPSIIPFPPPKKLERNMVNVKVGQSVSRQLVTGLHVVADIECAICGSCIGWKYVDAREEEQRYKVGKFILEGGRVVVGRGWEDGEEGGDDFQGGDGFRFVRKEGEEEEEGDGDEDGDGDRNEDEDNDEDNDDDNNDDVHNTTTTTTTTNNNNDSTRPEQGQKRTQKFKSNETTRLLHPPNTSPEGLRQLHNLEIEMGRRKPPPCPNYNYPTRHPSSKANSRSHPDQAEEDDIIEFNSSSEDECDDLFAGIWDAEVVRRRRRRKAKVSVYGSVSLWRRREMEE